jgi:hypothetical protein
MLRHSKAPKNAWVKLCYSQYARDVLVLFSAAAATTAAAAGSRR